MPSLPESLITHTAKTRFQAFQLTLPSVASVPGGKPPNVSQFLLQAKTAAPAAASIRPIASAGALGGPKLAQHRAAAPPPPPPSDPSALFRAATGDRLDVGFQSEVNTEFTNFVSKVCQAFVAAHNDWRMRAFLRGVTINGPVATGGSINGPSLLPMMLAHAPMSGMFGVAQLYARAICDGLSDCWRDWEQSVRVPGLTWYPTFTAFPGPQAPPMPNVPTPLTSLASNQMAVSADSLTRTMSQKLGQPLPYSNELFQSIAAGVSSALATWFPTQMVGNVMGMGSVPSFAPPYVPVAPVSMGTIIEAPGHFAM